VRNPVARPRRGVHELRRQTIEKPQGTAANSGRNSFPSGHAADTFAFATALERHLGWKGAVRQGSSSCVRSPPESVVAVRDDELPRFQQLFQRPPEPMTRAGTFTIFRVGALVSALADPQ
jgi:hypothetical protein